MAFCLVAVTVALYPHSGSPKAFRIWTECVDSSGSGIPLRPILVPASGSEWQMGGKRPAGWNLGQGCLEASAVPTQHVETRARGMGFLRQPGGWGPGERQRPPSSLGTLGDPGAKTFHSVPRPMHEPQTHGGSPGTRRASSKGTGWGPQGVGRRQAGMRRAGADASTAQHSTAHSRPDRLPQGRARSPLPGRWSPVPLACFCI